MGESAWFRLTQFKIEFKLRNEIHTWDPELGAALQKHLPLRGFYIEVGAHDGRSSSNTYGLESQGWQGILVEPILSKYFRIRQLRSLTSNQIYHAACVSPDYPSDAVEMVYADMMSFSNRLSTVDAEDWLNGSTQFLNSNEDNVKTFAPARTLNSILEESKVPETIDFLSIDVEGAEEEVLQGIDFNKYKFNLICIEAQKDSSITKIYNDEEYVFIEKLKNNYIFKHKRVLN